MIQSKGPTNLSEYFKSQGQSLPSLSERKQLYGEDDSYTGTAQQNASLMQRLQGYSAPSTAYDPTTGNQNSVMSSPKPVAPAKTNWSSTLQPTTTAAKPSAPTVEATPIQKPMVTQPKGVTSGQVGGAISSPDYVHGTPDWVKPIIDKAAKQYNIPAAVLSALLKQESGFNPNAKSPVGASGIAQFMPGTAKQYNIDPLNPEQAIPAAAKYISEAMDKYGKLDWALASYNAGHGAVDKFGGIPPYKETKNYVKNIMAMIDNVHKTSTSSIQDVLSQMQKANPINPPVANAADWEDILPSTKTVIPKEGPVTQTTQAPKALTDFQNNLGQLGNNIGNAVQNIPNWVGNLFGGSSNAGPLGPTISPKARVQPSQKSVPMPSATPYPIQTPYDDIIRQEFGDEGWNAIRTLAGVDGGNGENRSFDANAPDGKNNDGTIDRGLFRINSGTFDDFMNRQKQLLNSRGIHSYEDMKDPALNTIMAKIIYDSQGWNAFYGAPPDLRQ